MPRVAQFRIAAINDLFRQLRYAPRATRMRQMEAAERLIADIDPELSYPQDFVIFRITGYRPDRLEAEPLTFPGEAMIGDLVTLVQRLSDGLDLQPDHGGRTAVRMEDVARRFDVSNKTLQRYRRRGLVCHYVVFPEGKRLACFGDVLDRFVDDHRERLDRAATFSRIASTDEQRIIDAARALREQEAISLNEAALRLAEEHHRAHETIRHVLLRHDRRSAAPIFGEHGPLTKRDARLIERAVRWGVPIAQLAKRFGKSSASIARTRQRRRADLLRTVPITWVHLPTFDLADADSVILGAPAVCAGLDALMPTHDVLTLLEAAQRLPVEEADESAEHALIAGYNFLKRRARFELERLPRWPSGPAIDRIETDLRWAARLKRRLCSVALPTAIRRIELNLHRPLHSQPAERISDLLRRSVSVMSAVIEPLDPSQGQQFTRRVSYAMDRALSLPGALPDTETTAGRAAARHEPGTIGLDDLFDALTPWHDLLELRRSQIERLGRLDPQHAELLRARHGLGSAPPQTLQELAQGFGLTLMAARRVQLAAERALRDTVSVDDGRT